MKIAVCLALLAASGFAHAEEFTDTGRVLSAEPIYVIERRPTQHCWTENETVTTAPPQEKSLGGAIIGGIAGGILGHQVGGGSGKDVATAVGAATGAVVGDRIDNQAGAPQTSTRPVERCETTYSEQRVPSGYRVTYQFMNRTFTTNLPDDPGANLPLRISVSVASEPAVAPEPIPVPEERYPRPRARHYR